MPNNLPPRGIRNNNPGNVRANPNVMWQHQSGVDGEGFIVFNDPVYGIRCLCMVFRHYVEYDGLTTLRQMIDRWAPPVENDTGAYVEDVARYVNADPDAPYDIHANSLALCKAIILHENGECPYSEGQLLRGIHLSHIQ